VLPDEKNIETMLAVEAEPDRHLEPPELPDELIDELLAGACTRQEVTGPDGLLQQLTKRLGVPPGAHRGPPNGDCVRRAGSARRRAGRRP
jgi:hypothetical protein